MRRKLQPLWQILVRTRRPERAREVTCEECFAILEYLADVAVSRGDWHELRRTVQYHIEHCPDCREHHLRWLRELEALLASAA